MRTILDTNVVSELLKAEPAEAVLRWFAAEDAEALYLTSVTQAEMMLGARILPAGKRRAALESALASMFAEDFAGRVLPFDTEAARDYVGIVADRRASGQPISQFDAQIAAIARRSNARLATRNLRDFKLCGVALVDPWGKIGAEG